MKRLLTILFTLLIAVSLLTACGDNSEERVTCTICNGLGQVKYYFGEGDNDFTIVDRLLHHATVVTIKGKSYRLQNFYRAEEESL